MTVSPGEADLRARWRPSDEQIAAARAVMGDFPEGVITIHLLADKRRGFWDEGVEVLPLEGVFVTRGPALEALVEAARTFHAETGRIVTGGYTWHHGTDDWAVFEDVMAVFPEPTYRRKES